MHTESSQAHLDPWRIFTSSHQEGIYGLLFLSSLPHDQHQECQGSPPHDQLESQFPQVHLSKQSSTAQEFGCSLQHYCSLQLMKFSILEMFVHGH
jgi:hypothetical protein